MRRLGRDFHKVIFLVFILPVLLSCASFHYPVQRNSPYSSLAESVPPADQGLLAGRTIVLDPGHGNGVSGAIGRGGLREADVNMWVALYLAGSLRDYGAKVILTRASEGGPVPENIDVIRGDLAKRIDLANFLQADLFLSIHHNSSLDKGERYNAVETYYKMGDEGPSLDAARAIHAHLVKNLRIVENELLPGNYYLLRHSERPAVLGEASYISNPVMAKVLRKKGKLYLEAQAYLLGILDYFSKGRPVIRPLFAKVDTVFSPEPLLKALVVPGADGSPVDISSIVITREGKMVDPEDYRLDGDTLRYIPSSPLSSGPHRLILTARNLDGNAAIPLYFTVVAKLPAVSMDLKVRPESVPVGKKNLVLVEAFIRDGNGAPVCDGKEVMFRADGTGAETWTRSTRGGRAAILFSASRRGTVDFTLKCDGATAARRLVIERSSSSQVIVILKDGRSDEPIGGAVLTLTGGSGSYRELTSPEGYGVFSIPFEGRYTLDIRKRGYHRDSEEVELKRGEVVRVDLGLNPVQDGVMIGRVVVLDAEEDLRRDPMVSGYRVSDLNLMVADRLRRMLDASGAMAVLPRDRDIPLTPIERVEVSTSEGADVHLVLRHSPAAGRRLVQLSHYPGSPDGERLAGLIGEEIAGIGGFDTRLMEEASTVMRHTPSPVVAVNVMMDNAAEDSIDALVRIEAYSIYNGLLRFFGVREEERFSLHGIVEDEEGTTIGGALVSLDGGLTLRTGKGGGFSLSLVDGGYHQLSVAAEGFAETHRDIFIGVGGPETIRIGMKRVE